MLCIDTKSKILRNETAWDRMKKCNFVMDKMIDSLVFESVTADYGTSNTYRIHGISELTPASKMNEDLTFA